MNSTYIVYEASWINTISGQNMRRIWWTEGDKLCDGCEDRADKFCKMIRDRGGCISYDVYQLNSDPNDYFYSKYQGTDIQWDIDRVRRGTIAESYDF